jgi:hypothetical protein
VGVSDSQNINDKLHKFIFKVSSICHLETAAFKKHLYLDYGLCKLLGFGHCRFLADFENLTYLYRRLIFSTSLLAAELQFVVDNGLIEQQFHWAELKEVIRLVIVKSGFK